MASVIPARFFNFSDTFSPVVSEAATSKTVSSPATVPMISESPALSTADATTCAEPGGVFKTTILFETARRIENTISILNNLYPQGIDIAICREMTKIHEEVIRGSSKELMELIKLNKLTLKGEMVLVLRFSDSNKSFEIDESIAKAFLNKLPPKDAAKLLSLVTKESKREIYKQLLDL